MIYVLRFLHIKFSKAINKNTLLFEKRKEIMQITNETEIKAEDFNLAENLMLKISQIGRENEFNKWIIFKENGLLRKKTRILNSDGPEELEKPIMISRFSPIIRPIVLHIHRKLKHAKKDGVMTEYMTKYFTPRLGRMIQGILKSCFHCRK